MERVTGTTLSGSSTTRIKWPERKKHYATGKCKNNTRASGLPKSSNCVPSGQPRRRLLAIRPARHRAPPSASNRQAARPHESHPRTLHSKVILRGGIFASPARLCRRLPRTARPG